MILLRLCCSPRSPSNSSVSLCSSRGHAGPRGVGALSVERPPHGGSSLRPAGLAEESVQPEDLHLLRETRLPADPAGGLQRSVTMLHTDKIRVLHRLNRVSNVEFVQKYPNKLYLSCPETCQYFLKGTYHAKSTF